MTTGASGTYAFNGIDLALQPTTGKYVERNSYGIDGQGHPIYSGFRHFEMSFDLISPTDAKQIIDLYNSISTTGTVVACLPQWGNMDYVFINISGVTLQEPIVGEYFQGYITQVKWLLINIKA